MSGYNGFESNFSVRSGDQSASINEMAIDMLRTESLQRNDKEPTRKVENERTACTWALPVIETLAVGATAFAAIRLGQIGALSLIPEELELTASRSSSLGQINTGAEYFAARCLGRDIRLIPGTNEVSMEKFGAQLVQDSGKIYPSLRAEGAGVDLNSLPFLNKPASSLPSIHYSYNPTLGDYSARLAGSTHVFHGKTLNETLGTLGCCKNLFKTTSVKWYADI